MRRNFKQLYCWAISRGIHIFLLDGGATRHWERNEKSRGDLGRAWRAQSTSVSSFYLLHFPSPFFFSCFHSTKLWIDILPKNISANCTCKQHLILGGSTVEELFLQSPWWKLTSRKHCYKWYYGHFSLTKRFRNFQLRWKRNTRSTRKFSGISGGNTCSFYEFSQFQAIDDYIRAAILNFEESSKRMELVSNETRFSLDRHFHRILRSFFAGKWKCPKTTQNPSLPL